MTQIFFDPNNVRPSIIQFGNVGVICTGTQQNTLFDGNSSRVLGQTQPAIPTLASAGAGSLTAEFGYKYRVVVVNSSIPSRSIQSDASADTGPITNDIQRLTITLPTDRREGDKIFVYRTLDGDFSQYFFLTEDNFNPSTSSPITIDDDGTIELAVNDPIRPSGRPPAGAYAAVFINRLFIGGDRIKQGNFDWTSAGSTVTASDDDTLALLTQADVGKRIRNLDQEAISHEIIGVSGGQLTLEADFDGETQTGAPSSIIGPLVSTLAFSEINRVEEFPVVDDSLTLLHLNKNLLPVNPDDGQDITGMIAYQDRLLFVGKERSLWRVTGTNIDNFQVHDISKTVGLASNDSVAEEGGLLFFYDGHRGVWVYQNDGLRDSLIYISAELEKTFLEDIDHSRDSEAVAVIFNGFYILSVTGTGSTFNNLVFVYDIPGKKWMTMENRDINAAGVSVDSTTENREWLTGDQLGRVRESFTLNRAFDDDPNGPTTGTPTAQDSTTMTDTGATFYTNGNGLRGTFVTGVDATGATERVRITSNTATVLTFETTKSLTWVTYRIGPIEARLKTKRFDWGGHRNAQLRNLAMVYADQAAASDLDVSIFRNGSSTGLVPTASPIDMTDGPATDILVDIHGSQFEIQVDVDEPGHDAELAYAEAGVKAARKRGANR